MNCLVCHEYVEDGDQVLQVHLAEGEYFVDPTSRTQVIHLAHISQGLNK